MFDFYWFALLVGVNGLILIALTINVSRVRMRHQVSLGDGGNKALEAAIRAHMNGVEQVPMFALMVLALTYLKAGPMVLATLVIAFSLSRLFHAYGMVIPSFTARRIGAGVTYLTQLGAAVALIAMIAVK